MRKFENGLKVIGTDLGYGNIKTANTVTALRRCCIWRCSTFSISWQRFSAL